MNLRLKPRLATAVTAILIAMSPLTTGFAAEGDVGPGGSVVWARPGYPDTLDPHKFSHIEGAVAIANLVDTLVWRNPKDNKFYGGLAKSWTYSSDYKSLMLELRDDVTFHDGTKFNADAVGFTFDRIVDPKTRASAAASFMSGYSGFTKLGDFSIQINFNKPSPLFLEWLTHPSLAPISPTAVNRYGDKFGDNLVGKGPFRLVRWDRQSQEVVMEKNPDYNWAPSFLNHEGPPAIDRLVIKGILDAGARVSALEAGDVDMAALIPPVYLSTLSQDPNFTVVGSPTAGIIHSFAFNTQKPPLDDVAVRKALVTSVDLEGLSKGVFRGFQPVPVGPFRKGLACWDAETAKVWPYDTAKAAAMLDEAGWVPGADGIRVKNRETLTLTALWPNADDPAPAVYIQSEWRKIGVDLKIQSMDFNSVISESTKGNHQLTWGSVAAADPDVARTVFSTGEARNFTRVSDKELDQMLAAGAATQDLQTRCEQYKQVQHRIMELALILPYYDQVNYYVGRTGISGIFYRADGVIPYNLDLRRTEQ